MKWFMMLSVFMCLFMYLRMDPIKGRFFLVLGLLNVAPIISMNLHVWYTYYICLLFLRGVFVILVYFSRLSKFVYLRRPFWLLSLFLVVLRGVDYFVKVEGYLSINRFYYRVYLLCFLIIIFSLLFFINFTSYFLSLRVAIRKI